MNTFYIVIIVLAGYLDFRSYAVDLEFNACLLTEEQLDNVMYCTNDGISEEARNETIFMSLLSPNASFGQATLELCKISVENFYNPFYIIINAIDNTELAAADSVLDACIKKYVNLNLIRKQENLRILQQYGLHHPKK